MYTGEIEMSRVYYLCTHLSLIECINYTWKTMQSSVAFNQVTGLNTGPLKSDNALLNQTHCQGHQK